MEDIIQYDDLKTKVLKYILYKKRTEKEIRTKFQNESDIMLDDVIEELKELEYINDDDYIDKYVNELMNLQTLSIKELIYKLKQKGLESDNIEEYIENNMEILEEYEKKSAEAIFIKKANSMEMKDIIRYLKNKGYTGESIEFGKINM